ncbi:MAG TPA: hypothetical protein VFQ13_20165, partial [Anaerolineales bacterium]|nr:hypothetical protein [Anaerolineales bacterium]
RCGTPQLRKFLDGSIGAYSSCNSDYYVARYFSVSYLTIIAADNSFKTIPAGMVVQGTAGEYGYYEFGGWTTNQSEFFYNDQLGWRLYFGAGTDANGPIYFQHTRNGGDTWKTLAPVPWQDARFQFLDPQNGWALVTLPWGNALVKTADGGETWEEIETVIENH